jgi:hypothetical protein
VIISEKLTRNPKYSGGGNSGRWKPVCTFPIFQPSSTGILGAGFHPPSFASTLQILYILYINSLET